MNEKLYAVIITLGDGEVDLDYNTIEDEFDGFTDPENIRPFREMRLFSTEEKAIEYANAYGNYKSFCCERKFYEGGFRTDNTNEYKRVVETFSHCTSGELMRSMIYITIEPYNPPKVIDDMELKLF